MWIRDSIATGVVDMVEDTKTPTFRVPALVRWGAAGAGIGMTLGLALALASGLSIVLLLLTGLMIGGGGTLLGGALWLSQQEDQHSKAP